ncbi:MAG: glycosyltransferase [Alkalilacustris sp.]
MFTHILMTRFNLATPGRELAIRTQPGWLAGRFELFERYCLPSVAAQRTRDFHWIILFDIDTPQPFKDRIEALRAVFPFTPYYTPMFPESGWPDSVRQSFDLDRPLLLTTRLDNDDALAADFVERLHRAVTDAGCAPGAYNFRHGLIRRGDALYLLRHDRNAFFSWLEPVGPDMRTAPSIAHMRLFEAGPVRQIDGRPAWLQIVHGTNVSNKVRGRRVPGAAFADIFGGAALAGVSEPSAVTRWLDAGLLAPVRALRDGVSGLRQRLRRLIRP